MYQVLSKSVALILRYKQKKKKKIKVLKFNDFDYISKCSGVTSTPVDREKAMPEFLDWLQTNGVDTSSVEISSFEGYGYGLKAKKDIKVLYWI